MISSLTCSVQISQCWKAHNAGSAHNCRIYCRMSPCDDSVFGPELREARVFIVFESGLFKLQDGAYQQLTQAEAAAMERFRATAPK
jgi:hypothetical protein